MKYEVIEGYPEEIEEELNSYLTEDKILKTIHTQIFSDGDVKDRPTLYMAMLLIIFDKSETTPPGILMSGGNIPPTSRFIQ